MSGLVLNILKLIRFMVSGVESTLHPTPEFRLKFRFRGSVQAFGLRLYPQSP